MTVSVISFSPGGYHLERGLMKAWKEYEGKQTDKNPRMRFLYYSAWKHVPEDADITQGEDITRGVDVTQGEDITRGADVTQGEDITQGASVTRVEEVLAWTREQFERHRAILFIGACGIAVRSIAPVVKDKLEDSPVLLMDETGRHVIPILAGHVGGANALAEKIAAITGAEAVITTATDLRGKFAVDRFAAEHGFSVQNKSGIAKISSRILAGETVTLAVEGLDAEACGKLIPDVPEVRPVADDVTADIFIGEKGRSESVLWLKPRKYILGMGCKRGKGIDALLSFVRDTLSENGIMPEEICALASIDEKADEEGLWELADCFRLPFYTYSAGKLAQLPGEYSASQFVKERMGVDNVCERAALACCENRGRLILKKTVRDGMTLAVAERDWRV